MTKLVLHIGYPKTGTTSLQQFLSTNFDVLKGEGILYPEAGRINNAHYKINFSLGIGENARLAIEPREVLTQALREEIASVSPRVAIISSEYFVHAKDPTLVRSFFQDYDVSVFAYLRRHDKTLESDYAQSVKTNLKPRWTDIETFIAGRLAGQTSPYDYLGTLDRWSGAFGRERVAVWPFERTQITPDLYRHFLSSIGVPWIEGLVVPKEDSNVSLSAMAVDAIDAVQRSSVEPEIKKRVVGRLVQVDRKLPAREGRSRLSPAYRMALLERYAPSYREIAERYLGRPDGTLFREPPPDAQENWQPMAPLSSEDAVGLLVRALAPLLNSA